MKTGAGRSPSTEAGKEGKRKKHQQNRTFFGAGLVDAAGENGSIRILVVTYPLIYPFAMRWFTLLQNHQVFGRDRLDPKKKAHDLLARAALPRYSWTVSGDSSFLG